jgi:glycosyltransferase involved in cell wall biosynthesis
MAFSPGLYAALQRDAAAYDVLHVHSLFLFPQYAAAKAVARHGLPYIVSPRGSLDPYLRRRGRVRKALTHATWQSRLLSGATAFHLTSEEEARLTADVAPRVQRVVVPNGVCWQQFQELPPGQAFRDRFLKGSDAPLVLNIGRISHKKGLDRLVRALSHVRRHVPDCRLALVGPDDEGLAANLRALARDLEVADALVFTGHLTGRRKLEALSAANAWALPSHTENFGIAVVEALAAGVPVVVSPEVNLAPEIAANDAGLVCHPQPEELADAIAKLLTDPQRAATFAARGREFARRYDWRAVADRWLSMYAGAAAN